MKDIVIEVTAEDIEKGELRSADCCPIALAIKRKFGQCCPSVDGDEIEFGDEHGNWLIFGSPREARDFVGSFDNEEDVEPFTFTLREDDLIEYEDDDDGA